MIRAVIPGSADSKYSAADALCSVGLWIKEERMGVPGWRLGVDTALTDKRKRVENATRAANIRHAKARTQNPVRPNLEDDFDNPWG